jgi:hypothetical protein
MSSNNSNRSDGVNGHPIATVLKGASNVDRVGEPTGPRGKPPREVLERLTDNFRRAVDRRWPGGKPSNKEIAKAIGTNEATVSLLYREKLVERDWTLTSLLVIRAFTDQSLDELLGLPQTESMVERAVRKALAGKGSTVPPASTERPSKRPPTLKK